MVAFQKTVEPMEISTGEIIYYPEEMTANVRQNLNHAFLHSHSLFALAVEACLGQSAGG